MSITQNVRISATVTTAKNRIKILPLTNLIFMFREGERQGPHLMLVLRNSALRVTTVNMTMGNTRDM